MTINFRKYLSIIVAIILLFQVNHVEAKSTVSDLVINEIESEDINGGSDWVEFYNPTDEPIDISGLVLADDKGAEKRLEKGKTVPFPEGTIIQPKEFFVVETEVAPYDVGLGNGDEIGLYDSNNNLIISYAYDTHAHDTLGRVPDGTGDMVETIATKGLPNEVNTEIVEPEYVESPIKINEIESDSTVFPDYVEIINTGDEAIDISGWYILDDNPVGHAQEVTPLSEGTILESGKIFVFQKDVDFTFGLGKGDEVSLRNKDGNIIDEYSWSEGHAEETFSRVPDGTGEFIDYPNSFGVQNRIEGLGDIVINEIESTGSDRDWVEIFNRSNESIDISGWKISDSDTNDDSHYSIPLPEGTILDANSYFIFEEDMGEDIKHFNFGLGSSDSVYLYNKDGDVIDSYSWEGHAEHGFSRIPNGQGGFKDVPLTKGLKNEDALQGAEQSLETLDTKPFPGKQTYDYVDNEAMFLSDSSGLDTDGTNLWGVDNGTATIWKMNIDTKGNPTLAEGWENGKKVAFIKDIDNLSAAGPDSEGITINDNGNVFLAVERDNSKKSKNKNVILEINPEGSEERLIPVTEWDVTEIIDNARKDRGLTNYKVPNNEGLETIEWIPNSVVEGNIIDQNTKAPYSSSNYEGIYHGLFFTGLEEDGFIYVFALNSNGEAILISQIDTGLGMVMGLDYNELTGKLWALADNGRDNTLATLSLNGTENPDITYYQPPADFDITENNEGFAIANINVDGCLPTYWFMDGVKTKSMKLGWLAYKNDSEENSGNETDDSNQGDKTDSSNQGDGTEDSNQGDGTDDSNLGDVTEDLNQGDETEDSNQGDGTDGSNQKDGTDGSNQKDGTDVSNQGDGTNGSKSINKDKTENKDSLNQNANENSEEATVQEHIDNPNTGDEGIFIYMLILSLSSFILLTVDNKEIRKNN